MDILGDQRGSWINAWGEKHVRESPGRRFPEDDRELWDKLNGWISILSNWFVKNGGLQTDPVELAERTLDKVLRYSQTFRGDAQLTSWIFAIARNTLRSMLKRQKNTAFIEDELDTLTPKALVVDHPAEVEMLNQSNEVLVSNLLAQLENKRDAEILYSIKGKGVSYIEVAQRHGLEPSSVRAIVSRSLQFLSRVNQPKRDLTERKSVPQRKRVQRAGS